MSTLVKVGLGIGTVAGASGGAYGIYHNITTSSTYAYLLKGTLLSTNENENQKEWTSRLSTLNSAREDTLVDSLKQVKTKTNPTVTWQDLRNWCKGIIGSTKKEEKEFQNVQRYCTFSIKEKLSNVIEEISSNNNDSEWAVGHTALSSIPDEELVPELKTAKSQRDTTANASIKTWCNKAFANPYKGDQDQEFKNASKVCVKG